MNSHIATQLVVDLVGSIVEFGNPVKKLLDNYSDKT